MTATPEFSRPVAVGGLAEEGRAFRFSAEGDERTALARRLGLQAIASLEVAGRVEPTGPTGAFRLEAALRAEVVQTCVVTLQPVPSRLEAAIERRYDSRAADREPAGDEVVWRLDDDDGADALAGDAIDVGEAAAEQLALELDPFPRAPDAEFGPDLGAEAGGEGAEAGAGPFAALAGLRDKLAGRG